MVPLVQSYAHTGHCCIVSGGKLLGLSTFSLLLLHIVSFLFVSRFSLSFLCSPSSPPLHSSHFTQSSQSPFKKTSSTTTRHHHSSHSNIRRSRSLHHCSRRAYHHRRDHHNSSRSTATRIDSIRAHRLSFHQQKQPCCSPTSITPCNLFFFLHRYFLHTLFLLCIFHVCFFFYCPWSW